MSFTKHVELRNYLDSSQITKFGDTLKFVGFYTRLNHNPRIP